MLKSTLGVLLPLLGSACVLFAQGTIPNIVNTQYCSNTPDGRPRLGAAGPGSGDLRRIVLNAPNAVCNDGTPALMYVRAARAGATEPDGGSTANRWVIHFEGGGSCNSFEECAERWCGVGFYTAHQMSSTYEDASINRGGLLNRNGTNRLADRNLVMLNYCSSDTWAGRKSDVVMRSSNDPNKAFTLHFQGANIMDAAFTALERGVAGMPRLTEATDVPINLGPLPLRIGLGQKQIIIRQGDRVSSPVTVTFRPAP